MRYSVSLTEDGRATRHGYQWFNTDNDVYNGDVMQYTGMKDKNGKEIYQGDVLSHPAEKEPMIIVWHDRTAGFGLMKKGWAYTHFFHEAVDPLECTIIGNVHENPELLP